MFQQQQLQAQHLSHGHAIPIPLTPHPAGLQPPLPPGASTASLLALSSALSHQLPLKDERKHHDNSSEPHRGRDRCFMCVFVCMLSCCVHGSTESQRASIAAYVLHIIVVFLNVFVWLYYFDYYFILCCDYS